MATPEDMRFLRRLAPPNVRVKASGGIKTAQQVRDLLAAGADLVGTSSGVRIMQDCRMLLRQIRSRMTDTNVV